MDLDSVIAQEATKPRSQSPVLIACYSRTGHTASLAREMARRTGWDLEVIHDHIPRKGRWGQLRCLLDVLFDRRPEILTSGRDPSAYGTVVVATPLWMESLSAPMRSYLARHRGKFKKLAFACTNGDGAERAAKHGAAIADVPSRNMRAVSSLGLSQQNFWSRLDAFLQRLD